MTHSNSSDQTQKIAGSPSQELAAAKALGLIETIEMEKSVATNLELLQSHFSIITAAQKALEEASK